MQCTGGPIFHAKECCTHAPSSCSKKKMKYILKRKCTVSILCVTLCYLIC
jgi:hypothetical protein